MHLFPGRVLGVELAAIFAIFTSQAWNMAFSFYQSLKTVPADLAECATAFGLSSVAEILADGGALRHARPGVEHHDVDVGRLVLRGRQRGRDGRRQYLEAAGRRLLRGAGAGGAGHPRGVLRHHGDAGGDPRLRPAAVPAAGRLVRQVPVRDDGQRGGGGPLGAEAAAPHPPAVRDRRPPGRRVQRRLRGCAWPASGARPARSPLRPPAPGMWCGWACWCWRWRPPSGRSRPTCRPRSPGPTWARRCWTARSP